MAFLEAALPPPLTALPARGWNGAPLERHSVIAMVLVSGFLLVSCSTVSVRLNSDAVEKEGLQSAELLEKSGRGMLAAFGELGSRHLKAATNYSDDPAGRAAAAAHYLQVAVESRELLLASQSPLETDANRALLRLHNDSLARFAELWNEASRRAGHPLGALPSAEGGVSLRWAPDSTYGKAFFDELIAAKSVAIRGVPRERREGLGAALVAIRRRDSLPDGERLHCPARGLHVAATLILESVSRTGDGATVTLSFRNPLTEQAVSFGGRRVPVAGDFSAPLALQLAGGNQVIRGLRDFFDADERSPDAGVFLLEPYDPERIPVLLIHGLISVPLIWRELIPQIYADPELSKRYQVLLFHYPSSYPVIESAALMRDELQDLRQQYDREGDDPLSENMVVVGHSMGGILARLLATEIGSNLWDQMSLVPFEELQVSEKRRDTLERLAFFEPDPAVRRILFYSTPHRGSYKAAAGWVEFVSRAAELPADVLRNAADLAFLSPRSDLEHTPKPNFTSVRSLRPGSPLIEALQVSPMREGVAYHSVIGDRGKGDSPASSDGIVDYWSAHLEGAASELIVPTGHGTFEHPAGMEEMIRVLRLHVGLPPPPPKSRSEEDRESSAQRENG